MLLLAAALTGLILFGGCSGTGGAPETVPSPSPTPAPCPHEVWENGVCASCGEVCTHPLLSHEDGKCGMCIVCGAPCPHEHWENGDCADCGYACEHAAHDKDTLLCPVCGERALHHYESGVCTRCGQTPGIYADDLPEELLGKCEHAGTLENITYKTPSFTQEHPEGEGEPFEKQMWVYLPYNYDPTKKYDVVVLLHGVGQNEKGWLVSVNDYNKSQNTVTSGARLLDNMYEQGLCEDVIAVSCTYFRNSARPNLKNFYRATDYPQFIGELKNVILPLVAEKYSTWAESPDPADIEAAREHFGVIGLSMGAVVIYSDLIQNAPEIFAWYGLFSCADGYTDQMAASLEACAEKGYPVRCFYNGCGTKDSFYQMQTAYYDDMIRLCPALTDGSNAFYTQFKGWGHSFRVWYTGLYNCLRLFFRME